MYTYINSNVENRVSISPDENLQLFFSKQIAEKSSIFWHSEFNELYNTDLFKPRSSIEVGKNNYMGPYLGYQLILALSRMFGFLDIVTGLIGLLGVTAVYLLCREIYDENIGIIAIVIFGLSTSYLYYANMYYSNLPSFTFAMLSLYYFNKGINKQKNTFMLLSGFFLSFAINIRITEIMFILPMVVSYLLLVKKYKNNFNSNLFYHGILTLVGTSGLWYLTLKHIKQLQIASMGTSMQLSNNQVLVSNDPYIYLKYLLDQLISNVPFYPETLKNYIFGYSPLLFILFLFGAIYSFKNDKLLTKQRHFLYSSITLCIIYFLFYGYMGGTWSYNSETWRYSTPVDSSIVRYFMPIYAIFSIYGAILLRELSSTKSKKIIAVIILAVLIVNFATLDTQILTDEVKRLNQYGEINKVVQSLPENSVIFTKSYDKIISSDGNAAIYRSPEDFVQNPDLIHFYTSTDIETNLIPLIDELLGSNNSVYIINDATDLLESLSHNREYQLKSLPSNKMIWNVEKIND